MAAPTPRSRSLRFANATLIAATVIILFFVAQRNRTRGQRIVGMALAALSAGARRLRPDYRLSAAITVLPCIVATYTTELIIALRHPPPADAAARRGVRFDTRTSQEVICDLRREGVDAYPSIHPVLLFDPSSSATLPRIKGVPTLPLGGISSKTIVFCNEGGRRSIYPSDEYGFNNPKGIWTRDRIEIAAVGDSFAQGACVPPDETIAARLRERYPATVSLGISNNGPLMELAGIKEYVADRKAEIVLWVYCDNDLSDLELEKQSPLLLRYLEPGFRQGLAAEQPEIDQALMNIVAANERFTRGRFPGSLAAIGLTRSSTPIWLQDIVVGEDNSTLGVILGLRRLSGAASSMGGAAAAQNADFALFGRVLTAARDVITSWGGRLYFVYLADLSRILDHKADDPLRARVLEVARGVGLPVIDFHPIFAAAPDPAALTYRFGSHYNGEGYRLIAEKVIEAVALKKDATP